MWLASFCAVCSFVLVSCDRKPSVYRVNLDEAPEERWRQVVEDFKPYIPYLNEEIKGASQFACTSIIAEDAKGRILHGRNLDYMMDELMRNISIAVDFTRNGETLETAKNYKEALEDLTKMHFVSTSYLILGGTKSGEGALITRDRWSAHDVMELDVKSGRFFIVETNFDHWAKDEDGRRTTAEENLLAVGSERLDEKYMMAVLSTPPVANNWTVTSLVMSAARPQMFYETAIIREITESVTR